jgi:hypothetical protein
MNTVVPGDQIANHHDLSRIAPRMKRESHEAIELLFLSRSEPSESPSLLWWLCPTSYQCSRRDQ